MAPPVSAAGPEFPLFGDVPRWLEPPSFLGSWLTGGEWPDGPGGDPRALAPVRADELPALAPEGDLDSLRGALERQIRKCASLDPGLEWHFSGRVMRLREWCQDTASVILEIAARAPDMTALWEEARGRLDWYRSTGSDGQGAVMFTG